MKDHQVFEWVRREDLPRGNNPIDYTWAFRAKPNNDGLIDKFKARLCARGFREIFGIHYTETHAPVTTLTAFRGCVADAAFRGWLYDVFDIGSAYLRTLLTDLITFLPIDGFKPPDSRPGWLMRARKAIYGLKQAGRSWGQDLYRILTSLGMKRASSLGTMSIRARTKRQDHQAGHPRGRLFLHVQRQGGVQQIQGTPRGGAAEDVQQRQARALQPGR